MIYDTVLVTLRVRADKTGPFRMHDSSNIIIAQHHAKPAVPASGGSLVCAKNVPSQNNVFATPVSELMPMFGIFKTPV